MPETGPVVARPGVLTRAGLRRVLVVLCVTEVTSWGVLYYAFPVLAPSIADTTHWPVPTVTAAFSVSQVVAAFAGIPVGRLLDRVGPRPVMTAGSVLAAPSVVAIAAAPNLVWFFAAWTAAGLAMAAVLYQPAFAALTRWWGPRRVTALTALTLVAGLASTIFAPLTATLADQLDWRRTYVTLAVVLAAITIPAHAIGLRGAWPHPTTEAHGHIHHSPDRVARSRAFLALAAAMSLATFAAFAVLIGLVPLLIERGLSTATAAWALGLGGAGQVLGRLGYTRLAAATSVRTRTVLILAASAGTTALLGLVPGPAALLIAAAILVGATRGIFTLLQATAISDRWGARHYGHLNGLLSAPILFATALAPWAGTALAQTLGGYPTAFLALAVATAVAAVLAAASTARSQ
ncbi:MFS transporter [Actinopolymorpha sp. B9G3]|uniref:MFS transporter n=1 Tax=Actinopolymorpha sp. B9G3 TaxID=3158970 RepID=UPI0032D944B5